MSKFAFLKKLSGIIPDFLGGEGGEVGWRNGVNIFI